MPKNSDTPLGDNISTQADRFQSIESDLESAQKRASESEERFSRLAQCIEKNPKTGKLTYKRPKRWIPAGAWIIALTTIALSLTVGVIAYRSARTIVLDAVAEQNFAVSKSVVNQSLGILNSAPEGFHVPKPASVITEIWDRMEIGEAGRYLCIIDSKGTLITHSIAPDLIGKNVNHIPVDHVGERNELTVEDLIREKRSHSCLNKNARGIWQLAGYVYFEPTESLVVTHVPLSSLDSRITAAAVPWGISLAVISGCFFPLALALLYVGYRQENKQADAAFSTLADWEGDLQRQLAELGQIYRTSPVGLCFVDTNLRIVRINEELAAINGISIEKHIGKSLSSVLPELGQRLTPIYQGVIRSGNPAINVEVERKSKSNPDSVQSFLISYHPVFSDNKQVIGVSTVLQDVTKRKNREQELEELTHRLQTIREDERKRISREIHDELGQTLTALKMNLEYLEEDIVGKSQDSLSNQMEDRIVQSIEMVDTGIETVRALALRIRPSVLDQLGLQAALRQECDRFAAQYRIPCRFESESTLPSLSETSQTALFRLAQEFLNNIGRHSSANKALVRLHVHNDCVFLEVHDNGCGFDPTPQNPSSRLGLLGARERVQAMERRRSRPIDDESTSSSM